MPGNLCLLLRTVIGPGIGDHFKQSEEPPATTWGGGSQGLDLAELLTSHERYGKWDEA